MAKSDAAFICIGTHAAVVTKDDAGAQGRPGTATQVS